MPKIPNFIPIALLLILSTGAFYGSYMLITDPGGQKLKIPIELLGETPFQTFLAPGIILLISNAAFPLVVICAILMHWKRTPVLLIAQGFILIGWLSVQLLFNPRFYMPILHLPLFVLGAMLVFIGSARYRMKQAVDRDL